jgi:hypothetical protein
MSCSQTPPRSSLKADFNAANGMSPEADTVATMCATQHQAEQLNRAFCNLK